jgi:hypothetical protein
MKIKASWDDSTGLCLFFSPNEERSSSGSLWIRGITPDVEHLS